MRKTFLAFALALVSFAAFAADYPAPRQGEWIARDFKFHTGEVMAQVRLAYTTVGEPSGDPVLVLHGTSSRGSAMLTPAFAGELFGEGQPLDAKNTSSSFRTHLATATRPGLRMGCAQSFRATIMTTWSRRSIVC